MSKRTTITDRNILNANASTHVRQIYRFGGDAAVRIKFCDAARIQAGILILEQVGVRMEPTSRRRTCLTPKPILTVLIPLTVLAR